MMPVVPPAVSLFGATLGPASPPVSPVATGTQAAAGALLAPVPSGAAPAPFADLLTEAVGEVQHLEVQAKSAIEGLISGRGVDVHEAMIAAQKAGMGFELMLAVRNKALAAYQSVLGMQF